MPISVKNFPFKKIRESQLKVIDKLQQNWDKNRYFILEMPTGAGKSALAKMIAASNKQAFIVTASKQLQDQYVRDFKEPELVSIKGKSNYQCNVEPRLNVEVGPCILDKTLLKQCKESHRCSYYNQRDKAFHSNAALTSYPYFLYSTTCGKFWKSREVLILDECHLLEQQLIDWATIELDPNELANEYGLNFRKPDFKSGFQANATWLKHIWDRIRDKRNELFEEIRDAMGIKNADELEQDELDEIMSTHKAYYQLDKLYRRLVIFYDSPNKSTWIIEPTENKLIMKPLKVNDLFQRFVEKWGYSKIIFMSATILDLVGFAKEFGLTQENTYLLRVESTFDPKKSPIFFSSCGSMSYANLDSTLPQIKSTVEKILSNHKGQKGIIHAGNYKITKYLLEQIKDPRLIGRTDNESNSELLKMHEKSTLDTVLISPSMTTGTDLKDDLSRFQIIVKLPFASLADERIKIKAKQDSRWYLAEMMRSLVQASGRSIRNEDDWAVTYVLDDKFRYWVSKANTWLPRSFMLRLK